MARGRRPTAALGSPRQCLSQRPAMATTKKASAMDKIESVPHTSCQHRRAVWVMRKTKTRVTAAGERDRRLETKNKI
jgi:hypothetical protein